MRGDVQGWSWEINYTWLRKEACSDCINWCLPNITQTPINTGQTFPECLKLSVKSSVEVGVFSDSLWWCVEGKVGCWGGAVASPRFHWLRVFSHYSKKLNLCHPLPTPQRWQAEAHLKAQKSTKCQGKSSKVRWRATGGDKNADECKRTIYLTWVAMQEKMTSPVY